MERAAAETLGAPSHLGDHERLERACADLEAPFACVDLARRLRCDPEIALRAASERFRAVAGG